MHLIYHNITYVLIHKVSTRTTTLRQSISANWIINLYIY